MPAAPSPTAIVWLMPPGSMRHTVPAIESVAQTRPPPTAIPLRKTVPTSSLAAASPVPRSTRTIVFSLTAQRAPFSTARVTGTTPASSEATTSFVLGSIRETRPSVPTANTAPLPTTISCAPAAARPVSKALPGGSSIVSVASVSGSTRVTVRTGLALSRSPAFSTHRAPSPAATPMAVGLVPNRRSAFVSGSIREIVWSSAFSTQTAPSP